MTLSSNKSVRQYPQGNCYTELSKSMARQEFLVSIWSPGHLIQKKVSFQNSLGKAFKSHNNIEMLTCLSCNMRPGRITYVNVYEGSRPNSILFYFNKFSRTYSKASHRKCVAELFIQWHCIWKFRMCLLPVLTMRWTGFKKLFFKYEKPSFQLFLVYCTAQEDINKLTHRGLHTKSLKLHFFSLFLWRIYDS